MNKVLKLYAVATVMLTAGLAPMIASAAENPMDNVGVQHNMYLGCLHATNGSYADSLTRLVEKCGFDPGMPLKAFIKIYQPVVDMDPTMSLAEKMSPYRDRYSAYEFSFFERIDAVLLNANDEAQAAIMFAELEQEAIVKLDAGTRGGANVLGSLSVARHSLQYWTKYAGDVTNGNSAARRRWWHWVLIAVADMAGFAVAIEIGPLAVGVAATASETADQLIKL